MNTCLRDIKLADLSIIRSWRNHTEINRYMFSQHEINQEEHLAWFEMSQQNTLRTLNVYEENGDIKGFLQLQKKSQESNVYEWGFYICPEAIRGIGTKMAKLALKKIFIDMRGSKVFGEVLAFNLPSIKLHQKLGFYQEGLLRQHHYLNDQYYDVHCFGLLKSEWLKMPENKIY
ncbi:MAG: UDP-4-amino-4,6-dideoxy-N-acetyl-beta-L-altrosamine N-acetyltransferase [Methylococcaceae bacterium]|nr:UDP-4-amino-4,6-dideoxy-N-acetyl-beta-L-altrosamine N-acetyltransferase [Methylococcaceae bacterium]